ncbi:sialidase family protein [Labedaea rhizosphaerae]|uniref:sialidase family protein n=1 Tax=Labedaea rhizosphaerae TaxID=598644 RepID=UPI001FB851CF|nr:sialidase family protein [Labedaea rhizosphaerae]
MPADAAPSGAPLAPPASGHHKLSESSESAHAVPNPLLKEVFAEGEEEDDGDNPALSALCQSFLGKPSPYHRLAPNVDAIVGDATVPTGSQEGCSTAQNETTIAVNPANPRNIVAGSNDYRIFNTREARNDASGWAYTSFDGGRTWRNVVLPQLNFQTGAAAPLSYMDSAGDPAIAFGPGNTVYYATLVFSRTVPADGSQQASGIAVSVSHDGGLSWDAPAILELDGVTAAGTPTPTYVFNDKEWIAADPKSGKVYVTWTVFTYDQEGNYLESPIVASASTDFGRTWTGPNQVSPPTTSSTSGITSFGSGSNPQVTRDGTLHVAYETSVCASIACDQPADHDAVVVATSRDGGRTFRNVEVATDYDFPVDEDTGSEGLTGENFRINSFPQLAYDRATDHLWVTWADDRNGRYRDGESVRTNGDVLLSGSDGRHGWSRPATIGSSADEVFPAVAAQNDRVAVTYYTRAYDRHGIGLDYAYTAGRGSNIARGALQRITTQTANPQVQFVSTGLESGEVLQGVFIGDYTAVAIGTDLRIHPCWTDFRGNPGTTLPNQDVVTQAIALH